MKIIKSSVYIYLIVAFTSCGKDDVNSQKEKLFKDANELKSKIDSTHAKIDSHKKELDNLMYRIKRDSISVDSIARKLNQLKK